MATEEKLQEISPMKFTILIVVASLITFLLVTGAKKMAPSTFGTIS